jgi:hypothetical protein
VESAHPIVEARNCVPSRKAPAYRSYLLRCWLASDSEPAGRFVVEHVSGAPGRRGFDTFNELVDFLRAELLLAAEQHTPTDDTSPANDDPRLE